MIKFNFDDYTNVNVGDVCYEEYDEYLLRIKNTNSFYDVDDLFSSDLISKMEKLANKIKLDNGVLLILGIGGSYLGSKALIDSLSSYFDELDVYYAGNSLSSDYLYDLIKKLKGKNIYMNVISKSGTTLEITTAFNVLKKYIKKENVIFTSDYKSPMHKFAEDNKCEFLEIPKTIGGRFSIFTPAGLFPLIYAGIDVKALKEGAKAAIENKEDIIKYANIRDEFFKQQKLVEAYVCYEPKLYMFLKWISQLYGETLGKNKNGILPMTVLNTRDLHSIGQFIQEGSPILFQTVFKIVKSNNDMKSSNKSVSEINSIACDATLKAHHSGNISSNLIEVDKIDEYHMGYLMQFFMLSCYYSSHIQGVNPFNQPGVEAYKKEIKEML